MISKRSTAMYIVLILIGAVFPGILGFQDVTNSIDIDPGTRNGYSMVPFETIMGPGTANWEKDGVIEPFILKENGIYKMWYGASNFWSKGDDRSIGYAESSDGVVWTNRQQVHRNGASQTDHKLTHSPWVMKEEDTYRMWVSDYYIWVGGDWSTYISHLTSTDGINWGNKEMVLKGSGDRSADDDYNTACQSIVKEADGTYSMWYQVTQRPRGTRIVRATSQDGLTWEKQGISLPDIPGGNESMVYYPDVHRRDDGRYVIYYGGQCEEGHNSIFRAFSEDGVDWTDRERILEPAQLDPDIKWMHSPHHFRDTDGLEYLYFNYALPSSESVHGYRNYIGRINLTNNTKTIIADAGPDQIVDQGTLVTFDGSGSTDEKGIVNWTWTFTDNVPVTLYGVRPKYLFNNPGVYRVTLTAYNDLGNSDMDILRVTVRDKIRPVANAGPDQIVDEWDVVTFDGSGSFDNVGIKKYIWTFYEGTIKITLYGSITNYLFKTPGIFIVTLNVTDAAGNWATDTMTMIVRDITHPVANAGPDIIIDEGTLVTFNGSGISDNLEIVKYEWSFGYGSDEIILQGTSPSFTFEIPGIYTVTLNISDAAGNWATDFLTITVIDITPPIARAGSDHTHEIGTTVMLNASASSDNVGIVDYTWTFNDGLDDVTLHGEVVFYQFNNVGIHTILLKVRDAEGLTDTDMFMLTIVDTQSPIANAGSDMMVAVGSYVTLDGSLSSDNDLIVDHTWTFNYDMINEFLKGEVVSFLFDVGGTYEILLTVIDRSYNIANDTITITVIDTGIVKGKVLDDKGDPVEGAEVEITASNGEIHTATTGSDGSFSIEVHHGSFDWKITKEGYGSISGTGSVKAMEETVLDLSVVPLVKKENSVNFMFFFIVPLIIFVLIIIGIAIFLLTRRKKEPEEQKERIDDLPVNNIEPDPSIGVLITQGKLLENTDH